MPKRPAVDIMGSILDQSRALQKKMRTAPPQRERPGLESIAASSYRPPPPAPKHASGAHCLNCYTLDASMVQVDIKFGVRVCGGCGGVDDSVMCIDNECFVFNDDSPSTAQAKMRAEFRPDGMLGSFIASTRQQRGTLEHAAIKALQRAQLRLTVIDNNGATTTERDRVRLRTAIDDLATRMNCFDAILDDARCTGDQWIAKRALHAAKCTGGVECALTHRSMPQQLEGFAALFLQRASSRTAEGVGATIACLNFGERFTNAKSMRVMNASAGMLDLLKYDPVVGCAPITAVVARAAPLRVQASAESKGTATKALHSLGRYQACDQAYAMLDWMSDASLLVGKQMATVVSTAIYLALVELDPVKAPKVADVCAAVGAISADTVHKAINAVKASADYVRRVTA